MDCFSYFKLVNYLRKEKPDPKSVMESESDRLWTKNDYLKPVIEDDSLLMMEFEDFEKSEDDSGDEVPELLEEDFAEKLNFQPKFEVKGN